MYKTLSPTYDLDTFLNYIRTNKVISKPNKKIIYQYIQSMVLEEKARSTLQYNIHVMKFVLDHIPIDLDKLTIPDIDKLRSVLINWRRIDGQKVSDVTKKQYKISIKRFLHWYAKENRDNLSVYDLYMRLAERVNLGDTKRKNGNEPENKPIEHVFTQVEIDKMIELADTVRDKAILTVLAESGCRLGEITGCRVKDFKMLSKGCELKLPKGKTGPRIVPLLESAGRIDSWLRIHPLRDDPEASLWVKERGNHEAIKEPAIYAIVKRVAKKAGIERRAHPHMFRHTRATDPARENTNPEAMKQFLGWGKNSGMPSLYTHLSQEDLKTIIFRPYGIGPVEVKETKDGKFGSCPNCAKMVKLSESFCWNCGTTLDPDAKKKDDELYAQMLKAALQDPEALQAIAQAVIKLQQKTF